MAYSIETHRMNTRGTFFVFGEPQNNLVTAKKIAQDAAIEFQRQTRVVTYAKGFRILAAFSADGTEY